MAGRSKRCFEDQKSEIGLDQYEGRRYLGLKRHLILSAVSYLFLARVRQEERGENPELTVCQLHTAVAHWFVLGACHHPEPKKSCWRERRRKSHGTSAATQWLARAT